MACWGRKTCHEPERRKSTVCRSISSGPTITRRRPGCRITPQNKICVRLCAAFMPAALLLHVHRSHMELHSAPALAQLLMRSWRAHCMPCARRGCACTYPPWPCSGQSRPWQPWRTARRASCPMKTLQTCQQRLRKRLAMQQDKGSGGSVKVEFSTQGAVCACAASCHCKRRRNAHERACGGGGVSLLAEPTCHVPAVKQLSCVPCPAAPTIA